MGKNKAHNTFGLDEKKPREDRHAVDRERSPEGEDGAIHKNRPRGSGGAEGGCPSCHHPQLQGSYQDHKKKLLDGLKRVEGQVRGVQRMVDEERYCVDVLTQIAAARMALARLALIVLEDHTKGCVSQAIQEQEGAESTIEELMDVIRNMVS